MPLCPNHTFTASMQANETAANQANRHNRIFTGPFHEQFSVVFNQITFAFIILFIYLFKKDTTITPQIVLASCSSEVINQLASQLTQESISIPFTEYLTSFVAYKGYKDKAFVINKQIISCFLHDLFICYSAFRNYSDISRNIHCKL